MNFNRVTVLGVLLILVISTGAINTQRSEAEPKVLSRQRRASADFFDKIKSSITASIGKASASSAGASSGTSSSKHFVAEKPVEKEVYFDGWELKKSILNTLFQAVKAITGGVTAIKGQLIKGSGYALSHGGKLIAASGDAVTGVGKKIALSAKLLPPEKAHSYHKFFGSSSGHSSGHPPTAEDFTSFAHDDLVEFAQPHEIPVFAPEPHIPYLPVDVAYENHYPAPHYGPPPPLLDTSHSHITNYISTERKEQDQHYETLETPGLKTEDTALSTYDANQKAVDALRLLLRKLPNKLPKDNLNAYFINDDENLVPDNKIVGLPNLKQYGIPNDPHNGPIPAFKPIKSFTSTYTFQLGPFESVTRHTIGGLTGNEHITIDEPKTKILVQNPNLHQQLLKQPNHVYGAPPPLRHLTHGQSLNAQPLDLYHTMTLKNSAESIHQNNNNNIDFHHNVQLNGLSEPTKHHSIGTPLQTLTYLPSNPNKPNFEIQKSIQYQLQ